MTTPVTANPDVVVNDVDVNKPAYANRRISWGAIFAGVVIALIVQITLNLLGLAIGAAAVSPETDPSPLGPTFTSGAVIWMAATTLLSIFAGGYVAGHLAGVPDNTDGMLHGLLTWAIGTFIAFYLLSSGVGSVISGVSNVLSDGISLIGAGVADVAPQVADATNLQQNLQESIREEAGQLSEEARDLSSNSTLALQLAALARAEVGSEEASESKQVITDLLSEETSLSESEIRTTVNQWEQDLQQAAQNAEETLEQASADFADALAATGGILFLILIVGAFAGGAGGIAGRPEVEYVA